MCMSAILISSQFYAFRFSFATDIISGLSYLHSHEVVHGSLKMENCLVDDRWAIKLSGELMIENSK